MRTYGNPSNLQAKHQLRGDSIERKTEGSEVIAAMQEESEKRISAIQLLTKIIENCELIPFEFKKLKIRHQLNMYSQDDLKKHLISKCKPKILSMINVEKDSDYKIFNKILTYI